MPTPPNAALAAILSGKAQITRRCEIYESDGITLWDAQPRLIDGSVSVDYTRDERRSFSATLDNSDGGIVHDPNGGLWYDKIVKLYRGVRYANRHKIPSILVIDDNASNGLVSYLNGLGFTDIDLFSSSAVNVTQALEYDVIAAFADAGEFNSTTTGLLTQAYAAGVDVFTVDPYATPSWHPLITALQSAWSGGGGSSYTGFGSSSPTMTYDNDAAAVNLGTIFKTSLTGQVATAGRMFIHASATNAAAIDFYLYQGDASTGLPIGSALAAATGGGATTAGAWYELNFSTPHTLTANTPYVIVAYTSGHQYGDIANEFATADIAAPSGASGMTFIHGNNGCYIYGSSGLLPTGTFQDTWYGVDVKITDPSGGDSIKYSISPPTVDTPFQDFKFYEVDSIYSNTTVINTLASGVQITATATITQGSATKNAPVAIYAENPSNGARWFHYHVPLTDFLPSGVPSTLARFTTKKATVSSSPLNIITMGDGLAEGQGASDKEARWQDVVAYTLRSKLGLVGGNGFIPPWYGTYSPDSPWGGGSALDTSPTLETSTTLLTGRALGGGYPAPAIENNSGTITYDSTHGLGNRGITIGPADTVTYTFHNADAAVLFWTTGHGAHVAGTYQVDSNTPVSVTDTGTTVKMATISISLGSVGTHTVTLTGVAAAWSIDGMSSYDTDASKGIHFYDHSQVSMQAGGLTAYTQTSGFQNILPDLVVLELVGLMNWATASDSPSSNLTKVNAMITALNALTTPPSILIVIPYTPNTVYAGVAPGGYSWANFVASLKTITGSNVTIIDLNSIMGTADTSGSSYWTTDGLNLNNAGHSFVASKIVQTLLGNNTSNLADWHYNRDVLLSSAVDWLYNYQSDLTWEVQIGEFMIDSIKTPRAPRTIAIAGRDYTKKIKDSTFDNATSFASGLNVDDLIRSIAENAGITKFRLNSQDATTSSTLTFDASTDRWTAISGIAEAANVEVFFDSEGYLVTRTFFDPTTSPVTFYLTVGEPSGNLVDWTEVSDDSNLYNRAVVNGTSSDASITGNIYQGIAENHEPSSPTSIENLGYTITYHYSSPFFTSNDQCLAYAQSLLNIHALESFSLDYSAIVFAWLEAGEVVEIDIPTQMPGTPTRFLNETFNIPLTLDAMSGNAKRVTIVGSGIS